MSCYHPLIGIPLDELTENGKRKYILRSLKNSADPIKELEENDGILIPCGHCLGCRLDYSRKWADRMMLELETEKKGIFLTLTYDDLNCPWSKFDEEGRPIFGTLVKKDFQDFMKRLRKELSKKDLKIRFFASGEYGPKTLRPHYHAIIFGIGLCDIDDIEPFGRNDIGQTYYISEKIQKIWNSGFVSISDVSYETCAYVARYIVKKQFGKNKENYEIRNCIPEFSLMSRKPGIGKKYLEEHPDCLDLSNINISTKEKGRKIQIPKYFLKKLELTDKERYDKLMEQRRKFASDSLLLELSQQDLGLAEYLEVKEKKREELVKALNRKDV